MQGKLTFQELAVRYRIRSAQLDGIGHICIISAKEKRQGKKMLDGGLKIPLKFVEGLHGWRSGVRFPLRREKRRKTN